MKLCKCGCGEITKRIVKTSTKDGRIKGEYNDFIHGHHTTLLGEPIEKKRVRMKLYNPMHSLSLKQKEEWAKKISISCIGRPSPNPRGYPRPEISGEHHPNWQGGKSKEKYGLGWTKYIKEKIKSRDRYKCKLCGISQGDCFSTLIVHHKDSNKKNNEIINLITLCRRCHLKLHRKLTKSLKK